MTRRPLTPSQSPASSDDSGAGEQISRDGAGAEAPEVPGDPPESRLWLRDPVPSWDLGPPGFEATIEVFKNTPDERTIYLGPWEFVEAEPSRIVWQCAYRNELLEHFVSTADPSSALPFTLHGKHTEFSTRRLEGEQAVTFREPQRLRYTSSDGVVVFDQQITPIYRFEVVESSLRFQGDLRRKALLDCFDADIMWTDVHRRENVFGGVMGIAVVQRIKLWRHLTTGLHSLSVFASRWDRRHKEFDVRWFERELQRDDKKRLVRLYIKGCRAETCSVTSDFSPGRIRPFLRPRSSTAVIPLGDTSGSLPQSRPSSQLSSRPSSRASSYASSITSSYASSFTSSHSSHSSSDSRSQSRASITPDLDRGDVPLDIRYLAIEFSQKRDYCRFVETWPQIYEEDAQSYLSIHNLEAGALELPSPAVLSQHCALSDGVAVSALPSVRESARTWPRRWRR